MFFLKNIYELKIFHVYIKNLNHSGHIFTMHNIVQSQLFSSTDRPGHPSQPKIRNQVGTAVHLEWSPPPMMHSSQIQGYTIEYKEAGNGHTTLFKKNFFEEGKELLSLIMKVLLTKKYTIVG